VKLETASSSDTANLLLGSLVTMASNESNGKGVGVRLVIKTTGNPAFLIHYSAAKKIDPPLRDIVVL
jgi:hypothetical protein